MPVVTTMVFNFPSRCIFTPSGPPPDPLQIDLPEGAQRVAVTADGTESEAELHTLKGSGAVMLLLDMHISKRVHSSRRVFDILKKQESMVSERTLRAFPPRVTA
eukprot:71678-Pyramimonas_sp.AAC.2